MTSAHPMDHDQQFKALIQAFLPEFMALAVPAWADRFDYRHAVWLDKEEFPDAVGGRRREVDLLARLKVRAPLRGSGGSKAARGDRYLVLVHVEVDARRSRPDLRARMHAYGAFLQAKFDTPVLPIALMLHVGGDGIGWDEHRVEIWDEVTQIYRFRCVGLPALDGLSALESANLLEVSLATLMKVPKPRRAYVAAEALQRIAVARQNEMRTHLLASTVDAYMNLDAKQQEAFDRLLRKPDYEGARMIMTSWERKGHARGLKEGEKTGLQKGIEKGLAEGLLLIGTQRFGNPTRAQRARVLAITKPSALERTMSRLLAATDWDDLLREPK